MPSDAPERPYLLPRSAHVASDLRQRVAADFERFARSGLPADLEDYLRSSYGIDVSASYAGRLLPNPWGKASGQLSMRLNQVAEAADAGLAFVVLKTVIAEDSRGGRSMAAWAIKESRMVAEPILGKATGEPGWTISWKGRGWWQSFDDYLTLVREAVALGRERGVLIIPSVKYHLPGPDEPQWRTDEYTETTQRLLEAFGPGPMPLEKDFSPTLAGSDRSRQQATILDWLATIPGLIRQAAGSGQVLVGLKLFNALYDDAFQLAMLRAVHERNRPDFLVYANRLFDPDREFDGQRGIAYGGPDLSARNLRLLTMLRSAQRSGSMSASPMEISATGNICSGKMAVEYLLRGCTSFQLHTFFQLPPEVYAMKRGTKLQRALHLLYFHPENGLIVWMWHAAKCVGLGEAGPVRLLDLAALGASNVIGKLDATLA